MTDPPDPAPPSWRRPTRQVSAPDAPGALELNGLESAARSEGGLYAPPKTVPPVSDHKTIEMRTVDVRHAPDPSRTAVTERKLRAPAVPPPSSAVPSNSRTLGATARTVAPWLLALGAAVVLVAAFVALAHRASRATPSANASVTSNAVALPAPRATAPVARPVAAPATATPSAAIAHTSATQNANATQHANATASAKRRAPHHVSRNQPLF